MNYIKQLIEDNKILDLEFAFRDKFYNEGLRIIITGGATCLRFAIFDVNLKIVAIADAYDYHLETLNLKNLGYKENDLSYKKIKEIELERFWFKFLHKNYETYKKDYLNFKAEVAESMLKD